MPPQENTGSTPLARVEVATIILGDEYDSALFSRLRKAIGLLGGTLNEISWGVVGSQEVTEYEISLPGGKLHAEQETYIGLSIRGSPELIRQVANAMQGA